VHDAMVGLTLNNIRNKDDTPCTVIGIVQGFQPNMVHGVQRKDVHSTSSRDYGT